MKYRKIKILKFEYPLIFQQPLMFAVYRCKWLVFSTPFNPFNQINYFEKHIRHIPGIRTIASLKKYDDGTGYCICSIIPGTDIDKLMSDVHDITNNYFNQ